MRTKIRVLAGALLVAAAAAVQASDRVAVYGKVDKVVFEPNEQAPEAVQVWGVFAVAQRNNPNDYQPAAGGYLYFTLPANKEAARREWNDLKAMAGTGQVVAFGSRWEGVPRLRPAAEKAASPENYSLNTGVIKVAGRADYAPIRDVTAFKAPGK